MAKRSGYPKTCFIDCNNQLYGKLYIENNVLIDFGEESVYKDGVKLNLKNSYIKALFNMIISEDKFITHEEIYEWLSDYNPTMPETYKNIVANFITAIKKFIEVHNKRDVGYKLVLPQKIYKFTNVNGSYVNDMEKLFIQLKTPKEIDAEKAFNDSVGKFLKSGATALLDADSVEIRYELEKLSRVFNLITDAKYADETLISEEDKASVVVSMYKYITAVCRNTALNNVLKITGPLGSYKNRIIQYIYVMIRASDEDILPYYIDLADFERQAEKKGSVTESEFVEMVEKDLEQFRRAVEDEYDRIPLLILDGVRDFKRGSESVYNRIKKKLSGINCRLVVCMDSDFTMDEKQRFSIHPLVPSDFAGEVRIRSMSLYDKRAVTFIREILQVFDEDLAKKFKAEDIRESLLKNNFVYIDAYWLKDLLNACDGSIVGSDMNIADIYENFCLTVVDDEDTLNAAAEMAYNFEYGHSSFGSDVRFDMSWRLIRKHRSILEYLLARWYIMRLSELNFGKDSYDETMRKLSFFNMVPQRSVTRFVLAMLKGNDDYEHKILLIARDYYDDLAPQGKCELAFWLGRLKDENRRSQGVGYLRNFRRDALKRYEENNFDRPSQKRDAAFFLRSISISLIYENDEDAFVYYLNSLLKDKIANSVNRGFHLEYYGDKHYIPTSSLLDYEDDVSKGENTLAVLCLSLDERMQKGEKPGYVAALEIMTLCTLIQARLEDGGKNAIDVSPYIPHCIFYIGWLINSPVLDKLPDVKTYISLMIKNLDENSKGITHYKASVYDKFSLAYTQKRTGWVNENVPGAENIVEHMYNCWLIGMLYLPDESDEPGYDKNTILNMLLIHDLGETVTGDITRPEKEKNPEYYADQERKAMHDLLLFSGAYPSSPDLSRYLHYWNEFDCVKRGINALIAKDIDNLQTTYRFCRYYLDNPGLFSDERVRYWLGDIRTMKTAIGRRIMDTLVVSNPMFKDILEKN